MKSFKEVLTHRDFSGQMKGKCPERPEKAQGPQGVKGSVSHRSLQMAAYLRPAHREGEEKGRV